MRDPEDFASYVGVEIEPWMRWPGWEGWVGCDVCADLGPHAPCWGHEGCHGYLNGCGCRECMEREAKEWREMKREAAVLRRAAVSTGAKRGAVG